MRRSPRKANRPNYYKYTKKGGKFIKNPSFRQIRDTPSEDDGDDGPLDSSSSDQTPVKNKLRRSNRARTGRERKSPNHDDSNGSTTGQVPRVSPTKEAVPDRVAMDEFFAEDDVCITYLLHLVCKCN